MCVGVRCNVLVMGRARTRANQATVYGPGFYLYTALLPPRRASYYIQPERGIITRRSQIGEVHNRLCLPCPQKKRCHHDPLPTLSSFISLLLFWRRKVATTAMILQDFFCSSLFSFLNLLFFWTCNFAATEGKKGRGKGEIVGGHGSCLWFISGS